MLNNSEVNRQIKVKQKKNHGIQNSYNIKVHVLNYFVVNVLSVAKFFIFFINYRTMMYLY